MRQRPPSVTPVEAAEMTAAKRYPDHNLAVDISASRAEARHGDVVDLGEFCLGVEPEDPTAAGKDADGIPDRAVYRIGHHGESGCSRAVSVVASFDLPVRPQITSLAQLATQITLPRLGLRVPHYREVPSWIVYSLHLR
jgi:hypothetical protein